MKSLFKLGLMLCCIFVFGACKKEVTVYSCDPDINEYVIENMEINQQITRKELSELPFEYQNAVFLSLTYQNRLRIFKEKIDLVLNTINELSEDEKDALLMLRNETPESVYDNKNGEKPHPFIENWEEMVRKDLGWTDIDIEIYVGTWNTPSELNTMYYNASNSNTSLGCTCRSFWGCPGFSFCQTYSCDTPPNGGCGIVGTANCLGLCPLDMEPGGSGNNIYENLSSKYVF